VARGVIVGPDAKPNFTKPQRSHEPIIPKRFGFLRPS
jgi:hypothetical protein